MDTSDRFVAQILETSAAGYAGLTASLLFERHPDLAERYEPDGFSSWKAQLQRWLVDLSASVDTGEPALFENRMLWTKKTFEARQAPTEDLAAALGALCDTLKDRLPEGASAAAVPTLERAMAALRATGADAADEGRLDPSRPTGRLAMSYVRAVLEGDPRGAVEQVLSAVDGGLSIRDAYLDVLIPVQREVGFMWHDGELNVAEEHVITSTTQRLMALLCDRGRSAERNGKRVLLACVTGNVHDIGIRAISDFFEMAGWSAINLGADVPPDEIARGVQFFDADLVVLAATLDPHLKGVQRSVDRIRSLDGRDVKVIVGGPAFERVAELWKKVGADGHAARIEEAEPLGARLNP